MSHSDVVSSVPAETAVRPSRSSARPGVTDGRVTPAPLDVAIVGAPKCGTTSLYMALCKHPDVQGTTPKETYYFCDEFTTPESEGCGFQLDGWDGFEACFSDVRNGRKRVEATSINLYQNGAMAAFGALRPQPLVVVTLRCPAEQIRSEFYYHRSYGRIDASVDFATYAEALLAEDPQFFRGAVANRHVRQVLERAMSRNRYVEWLDLWAQHLPPEQLFVTTLHELSEDPVGLLKQIATRVDLDPGPFDDVPQEEFHQNPTGTGRVRDVGLLWRVGRRVVPHGRIRRRLAAWDRVRRSGGLLAESSDALENEILERLGRRFDPYNRELAARYGVDTSSWRPFAHVAP